MPKKKKALIKDDGYHKLKPMPSEEEWLTNCATKSVATSRAYKTDINDFKRFVGITHTDEFRNVTRKHVIDWVQSLMKRKIKGKGRRNTGKKLSDRTITRKVYSLGAYYKYCCAENALRDSPVKGVNTPGERAKEGAYAEISGEEGRKLLDAPPFDTLVGKRDRAILATFLFHGLRRSEISSLKVGNMINKDGEPHFFVKGKGRKGRWVLIHPIGLDRINVYLDTLGHREELDVPLFCPLKKYKEADGELKPLTSKSLYNIVMHYAKIVGIETKKTFSPHALRGTAATRALRAGADIKFVQLWLGHADVGTTLIYDSRKSDSVNSPTRKVNY